jgi:hypothetical protein
MQDQEDVGRDAIWAFARSFFAWQQDVSDACQQLPLRDQRFLDTPRRRLQVMPPAMARRLARQVERVRFARFRPRVVRPRRAPSRRVLRSSRSRPRRARAAPARPSGDEEPHLVSWARRGGGA